jgi:hypothetical protein
LKSQDEDLDNHFGNYQNAIKAGYKFYDENADGQWQLGPDGLPDTVDDEEDTIAGWEICANGNCTTTNANGRYELSLRPGSYTVSETCPAGEVWIQSFPVSVNGCGSGVYEVTLSSGQHDLDNHFGNYQQVTIAGTKYKDVNANGSRETAGVGEPGLGGWMIVVFSDDDKSGDLSAADSLKGSTTTDSNGAYSFTLNPGDYIVCEMAQDNWEQTEPDGNDACSYDSGLADDGYVLALVGGVDQLNKDFGNTPLSDIDVNFYDLTGFTNASIVCVDEGDNSVGTTAPGADPPETTLTAEDLQIGTYTCTIVITDP